MAFAMMSQSCALTRSTPLVSSKKTCRPTIRKALPMAHMGNNSEVDNKGPSKVAMLFGALAAAQIAALPLAGGANAALSDVLPKTASRQEVSEINRNADNLPGPPTIKEVSKANPFSNQNIGSTIDANTPDLPNPAEAAGDLGRSIGRATPDLPSNVKDFGGDLKQKAGSLGSNLPNPGQAGKDLGRAIDQNTPDLPSGLKNLGADLKQKAKEVTGGLSDATLPNPADKTGKDLQRSIGKGASDLSSNVKGLDRVGKTKGKEVANKVGRDTSAVKGIGGSVQQKAGELASSVGKAIPDLPNPGDVAGKVKQNVPSSGKSFFDKISTRVKS